MTIGAWFALAVSVTIILGVFWRLARGIYRLVRVGETALDRLGAVEAQMKNNGGDSMRDVLDQIHTVAVENQQANARVEEGQRKAAALAGEAATLAATADDQIKATKDEVKALRSDFHEQAAKADRRHDENTNRLDRLERSAYEEWQRREFYVATLRELYGIELDQPDD